MRLVCGAMYAELHRPLTIDSSRRRWLRPTAGDGGLLLAFLVLAGLSAFPAYLDRPERGSGDRLAERAAQLAANATTEIAEPSSRRTRGGALSIDVDAALAKQRLGEQPMAADAPYQPATVTVMDVADLRQSPMMAHLPDDALIEKTEYGPLPMRGPDGRRPFDVYAGRSSGRLGARIAIVVGGLGISQTGTQAAIQALPPGVTFAFAANGNSLDRWMQAARREGHEILLQVPMEPVGYPTVDPGENTVTAEAMRGEDFSALYASLGRLTNYVGIMNYMGGQLSANAVALDPLMRELSRRGLMYLDDGSSMRSVAGDVAQLASVPAATTDMVLDAVQEPGEIRRRLDQLEQAARAKGTAVGVASAFEASTAVIADWIAEAEKRGVEIIPVSAAALDPERR
ncbi:hypothetical protein SAMN06297251_11434 [Fulvimarina manganoxydans]|uniref:Divergent polysaccharide deacetylase n=1 Tax=Fulvimarina manganoxydans TaxID=937218 RepID=A0A1W2DD33_9HYPH|nr:divergent polysaccharide deacetylase family protein [Fulvimarina manganoxydans]SMC95417.1 hypothetical protein SAMN06297251_11434 [Fulvimarina manganoxydans]